MPGDDDLSSKLRRLGGIDNLRTKAVEQVYALTAELVRVLDEAFAEQGSAQISMIDSEKASWRIDAKGDNLVKFEIKAGWKSPMKEGKGWLAPNREVTLACWCVATRPTGFFDSVLGGKVTDSETLYWDKVDGEDLRWCIFDSESNRYVCDPGRIKDAIMRVINKQIDALIAERSPT